MENPSVSMALPGILPNANRQKKVSPNGSVIWRLWWRCSVACWWGAIAFSSIREPSNPSDAPAMRVGCIFASAIPIACKPSDALSGSRHPPKGLRVSTRVRQKQIGFPVGSTYSRRDKKSSAGPKIFPSRNARFSSSAAYIRFSSYLCRLTGNFLAPSVSSTAPVPKSGTCWKSNCSERPPRLFRFLSSVSSPNGHFWPNANSCGKLLPTFPSPWPCSIAKCATWLTATNGRSTTISKGNNSSGDRTTSYFPIGPKIGSKQIDEL